MVLEAPQMKFAPPNQKIASQKRVTIASLHVDKSLSWLGWVPCGLTVDVLGGSGCDDLQPSKKMMPLGLRATMGAAPAF